MSSVAQAARAVLLAGDPYTKVRLARGVARAWRRGGLAHGFDVAMPDRPARPPRPELMPASRMPQRGKGGSERGRIAMLHALAHIEFADLAPTSDIAGRLRRAFPAEFAD